jgi:Protein of unknown function (DUF1706)
MNDKAALLRDADEAFAELHRAVDGLTDEEAGRVWLGTWGTREILVHISGWHDAMASALDNIGKGAPAYAPGTYDDFDAWNARFVRERAGVKLADVIAELDISYRRFIDAATALPEAHFAEGSDARGAFEGAGAGHYREHAVQVREWRQATAR